MTNKIIESLRPKGRNVRSVLRAMNTLFSDAKRWTRGSNAKDAAGWRMSVNDEQATCWCLRGAAMAFAPDTSTYQKVMTKLSNTIKKTTGLYSSPVGYNDANGIEEVRRILRKASR